MVTSENLCLSAMGITVVKKTAIIMLQISHSAQAHARYENKLIRDAVTKTMAMTFGQRMSQGARLQFDVLCFKLFHLIEFVQ